MGCAIRWLKRSAEQEDAEACKELARCYREGIGVDKDTRLARKWERNDHFIQMRLLCSLCAAAKPVVRDLAGVEEDFRAEFWSMIWPRGASCGTFLGYK